MPDVRWTDFAVAIDFLPDLAAVPHGHGRTRRMTREGARPGAFPCRRYLVSASGLTAPLVSMNDNGTGY